MYIHVYRRVSLYASILSLYAVRQINIFPSPWLCPVVKSGFIASMPIHTHIYQLHTYVHMNVYTYIFGRLSKTMANLVLGVRYERTSRIRAPSIHTYTYICMYVYFCGEKLFSHGILALNNLVFIVDERIGLLTVSD